MAQAHLYQEPVHQDISAKSLGLQDIIASANNSQILAPSTTEYYSDRLTKYYYIFMIEGNTYTFNTLSTNCYDAYASLKDFFETFVDFGRLWIDLNNKYRDIVERYGSFYRMSKYSETEKAKIVSTTPELQKLDDEISEIFDILSNLLNMYTNIDYHLYNSNNMIQIINIIQYIKCTNVSNFDAILQNKS